MAFALGSLYHGTKFAVEGISESLYYEMGEIGVQVKLVEPGFIATDFGDRSFDFQSGDIADYQPLIGALMKQWQNPNNTVSPPNLVAEVIHTAITDNKDQLRYRAGSDAHALLENRKKMSDAEFSAFMRQQLGR